MAKRVHTRLAEQLLTPAQFLALPAQTDGTVVRVQADAAAGVIWRFRFNAGSANAAKWELDGGRPLQHEVLTVESKAVSSAVYGDLPTVGPSVVAPLTGDYDLLVESAMHIPATAIAGSGAAAAPKLGAAAVSDNDYITFSAYTAGTTTQAASASREMRRALAAGDTVKLQYRGFDALVYNWSRRHLAVTPVRVVGP